MGIRRFDVNCFLGKWPDGGPTLDDAAVLLEAMERLGIERALVRHTLGWHDVPSLGNSVLMADIAGHEERLVPCWAALPPGTGEMGPLKQWLVALDQSGVRAICLYPTAHGYPLTSWQCDGLLGPLAERHCILLLELSEVQWESLHWLCSAYSGLRVIVLNTYYRVLRPLYALLDAHPNLYVDTSTLCGFRAIEDLCERFGAERLLFGTGQPRADGAGAVAMLAYASLNEDQVQAIAGGNLERLLRGVQL